MPALGGLGEHQIKYLETQPVPRGADQGGMISRSGSPSAWCTELPGEDGEKPETRGFGFADNCAMYRGYVGGNGARTSDCVEVPTKK